MRRTEGSNESEAVFEKKERELDMRIEELWTLAGSIAAVQFPVYGIVDRPLDLILCLHGMGSTPDPADLHIVTHVSKISLSFTSQRYPSYTYPPYVQASEHLRIASKDAEEKDIELTIDDISIDSFLQGLIEQKASHPFLWEGTLTIAGTPFSGKIRYHASPLHISVFLLTSEKTILLGDAYGPSCDELVHLLKGLQVINGHNEVIKQYEEEMVPWRVTVPALEREESVLKALAFAVDIEARFPVYGIIDRPLDLRLCHHDRCFTQDRRLMSVQLTFTSPRYGSFDPNAPQSRHFRVDSVNAQMKQENREYTLEDVNLDPFLQEQIQQAGEPFSWEETFFLSGIHFSGRIRHYASPHHLSVFLLTSERTILMGYAFGPSCDELMHLLEGLQVISRRDEIIRQYEEDMANV
jgi:hypothetical protein